MLLPHLNETFENNALFIYKIICQKYLKVSKEYAQQYELNDFNKLTAFNKKLKLKNLKQTDVGHYCDATGEYNNKQINIELKSRNQNLVINNNKLQIKGVEKDYVDNTLFIESHKIADLLVDYVVNKTVPLYVNFLNNCTIVFNLSKLTHKPIKKHIRAFSKWKESFEIQDRLALYLYDAYIYDYNNKLIYKPTNE